MFKLCLRLIQSRRMPYYAVRIGRNPGVYKTWDECKTETVKFPKARYKKFDTEAEAQQFVDSTDKPGTSWGHPRKNSGGSTPSKGAESSSGDKKVSGADLEIADTKIEVLREQLAIAKKEKSLIEKEKKLQELKGKEKSKSFTGERPSPYKKSASSSSADWKQNRSTKPLDLSDVRQLHTEGNGDSSSDTTVVYTDGCCIMNGAHGACGGIGVYWGPDHPMNTSEKLTGRQTNNRAEIHAAIRAVEQAKMFGVKDLTIKTDSNFMIKAMTQWISGWKKKGWVTAAGSAVINKEDFQELEKVSDGINITYVHVPGHKGIEGNECADKLANAGARIKPK